jgi:hypothetical protein
MRPLTVPARKLSAQRLLCTQLEQGVWDSSEEADLDSELKAERRVSVNRQETQNNLNP